MEIVVLVNQQYLLHSLSFVHSWCIVYINHYERAKVKVKVTQSCPTLCDPIDIQFMEFSRPEYWSGQLFPSPGDLSNPGIKPRTPTLQADSLPAEPPGKPRNTGVGSLALLQRIFPTQGSNGGCTHCRRTLCQPSCAWIIQLKEEAEQAPS